VEEERREWQREKDKEMEAAITKRLQEAKEQWNSEHKQAWEKVCCFC
jgi:thermostable 8-oxoguanine DNA glycosylase